MLVRYKTEAQLCDEETLSRILGSPMTAIFPNLLFWVGRVSTIAAYKMLILWDQGKSRVGSFCVPLYNIP